jgi:hypothetical protein
MGDFSAAIHCDVDVLRTFVERVLATLGVPILPAVVDQLREVASDLGVELPV